MATHHLSALDALGGQPFTKAHATGNDFVLLADPEGELTIDADQAAAVCDRHLGIGADGLIRAVPAEKDDDGRALLAEHAEELPGQEPEQTIWFMDYRNGDGSLAEMCGNGVRAFVHFLRDQQLVSLEEGQELTIITRGGAKTVRRVPEGYAVGMGVWSFIDPELAQASASDSLVVADGLTDPRPALSISMGNPHTVVALSEERALDALGLGTAPTVDPRPPHGTNVEFVVPDDPLVSAGEGRVRMRVHERGVGETMSCGTGACAAAAAVRVWAAGDGVASWVVAVPGGEVRVRFLAREDGAEDVELSGPAELVFTGTLG
ncbi:diaminopimelate epimerase [Nesterenkonia sp. F]|uniref:diaminopimelate epimerase n=1 Tax=Nesterenkonia sp. F TaxID=795955 RepID=UPI000255CB31|nr:diaminopimelate epimerase [Nesterenkonia sp. F]